MLNVVFAASLRQKTTLGVWVELPNVPHTGQH